MAIAYLVTNKDGALLGPRGGFLDDVIQDRIISALNECGIEISPYDGSRVPIDKFKCLQLSLEKLCAVASKQDENWPLNSNEITGYYKRCAAYKIEEITPRLRLLEDCHRLLHVISSAIEMKADVLQFIGD